MRRFESRFAWRRVLCLAAMLVSAAMACAAEPATDKNTGEIIAHAFGADGKPAAQADVQLFSFDPDWRYYKPCAATAQTDASGTVRFEHLAIDAYLVAIRAGQDELALKDVTLLDSAPRQEVDLTLGKPATGVLRVRDGDGQPVAGAWVHSLYYTGADGGVFLPEYSFEDLGWQYATSDEQGEITLPALPEGGRRTSRSCTPTTPRPR